MAELANLDTRIRARLSTFGCCEGYLNRGLERAQAAVLAALACHPYTPTGIVDEKVYDSSGAFRMTRPRLLAVCNGCNVAYPCDEVRHIAAALELEVPDV